MSEYYVCVGRESQGSVYFFHGRPRQTKDKGWEEMSSSLHDSCFGNWDLTGFLLVYGWYPQLIRDEIAGELWQINGTERIRLHPSPEQKEPQEPLSQLERIEGLERAIQRVDGVLLDMEAKVAVLKDHQENHERRIDNIVAREAKLEQKCAGYGG